MEWLRNAVEEYVRNNSGCIDYADIVSHFKLRADVTLKEVSALEKAGIMERRHVFDVKYAEFNL